MSKLTDIKYRIDQLDGGAFQNLCDAYLVCKGYGTGYSLGMKTGTDKTAKGNPDTYFLQVDGKYVLVMYTTQKDCFFEKAFDDLKKCFDSAKTGLLVENIAEIVYCHTCGRISAGDDKKLRDFCINQNSKLTLIGLDELGYDLYLKYPRLAKDFLGICIDTGQITSMSDFLQIHDANQMSAPLNTKFLFREDQLKTAKEKLSQCDVLVISGPPGVGKTRLALQICEDASRETRMEILCIKSNGLELYEDLISAVDGQKDYLIFIDDANELTGLHFVLKLLPRAKGLQERSMKVIMTVRDYARQKVVSSILEVTKPEILKVGLLKDDEIQKLIERIYGITNPLYLERISNIAEGNARLAMLAGKIAADTEQLNSIQDATELYAHYYGKQIESLLDTEAGIKSASIIAFFQSLRLDALEKLCPIFETVDLSEDQFVDDIRQLHALELVDLRYDKAARISDQSFSNYLIKYTFVDKQIIPLSQMIRTGFFINKERTITACNILLNVFSDSNVQNYVEEQVNIVWDDLRSDTENFFPFFKSFFIVRPTESLIFIKDRIDQEPQRSFDLKSMPFQKTQSGKSVDDDILSILCGFKSSSLLSTAIDLMLLYYQKRPDLFEQFFSALAFRLGADKDSLVTDYYTQNTVVERICFAVDTVPTEENRILFVRLAEEYLQLSFSRTETGRQNTITFYTIPLMPHEIVLQYRKKILDTLYKIYISGNCHKEIESLLMDYGKLRGDSEDYEIIRAELPFILDFFSHLSSNSLYHCVIAEHINSVAQSSQYDIGNALDVFLHSKKYLIFHALTSDLTELVEMGYLEYEQHHQAQIRQMVSNYGFDDIRYLIQVCSECLCTVDQNGRLLTTSIGYVFEAVSNNQDLFVAGIMEYINANTPYDIHVNGILRTLFSMMSPEKVKGLIESHDFTQKNVWLWAFYTEFPSEQITMAWVDHFFAYLEIVPQQLRSSPYRPLDLIENKFKYVDEDIVLKASKVIASRYSESPWVFSLYFYFQMNPQKHAEAQNTFKRYQTNLPLLEDIYLKSIATSNHDDYHGYLLAEIIFNDQDFLSRYLDQAIKEISISYGSRDHWLHRLMFIWTDDRFAGYMDLIAEYCLKVTQVTSRACRSVISQLLLHEEGRELMREEQNRWIERVVEKHFSDDSYMRILFSAIADHSADRRRCALAKFLEQNKDYSKFEMLPLEAASWGGWGSMIPHMHKRIIYLESILPLFSGVDYLKHRQRVERDIENWKSRIKSEEIRELLESMG